MKPNDRIMHRNVNTNCGNHLQAVLDAHSAVDPTCLPVTVMYDFLPQAANELPVVVGQHVFLLYQVKGWAFAKTRDGRHGYVPLQYCREEQVQNKGLGVTATRSGKQLASKEGTPIACSTSHSGIPDKDQHGITRWQSTGSLLQVATESNDYHMTEVNGTSRHNQRYSSHHHCQPNSPATETSCNCHTCQTLLDVELPTSDLSSPSGSSTLGERTRSCPDLTQANDVEAILNTSSSTTETERRRAVDGDSLESHVGVSCSEDDGISMSMSSEASSTEVTRYGLIRGARPARDLYCTSKGEHVPICQERTCYSSMSNTSSLSTGLASRGKVHAVHEYTAGANYQNYDHVAQCPTVSLPSTQESTSSTNEKLSYVQLIRSSAAFVLGKNTEQRSIVSPCSIVEIQPGSSCGASGSVNTPVALDVWPSPPLPLRRSARASDSKNTSKTGTHNLHEDTGKSSLPGRTSWSGQAIVSHGLGTSGVCHSGSLTNCATNSAASKPANTSSSLDDISRHQTHDSESSATQDLLAHKESVQSRLAEVVPTKPLPRTHIRESAQSKPMAFAKHAHANPRLKTFSKTGDYVPHEQFPPSKFLKTVADHSDPCGHDKNSPLASCIKASAVLQKSPIARLSTASTDTGPGDKSGEGISGSEDPKNALRQSIRRAAEWVAYNLDANNDDLTQNSSPEPPTPRGMGIKEPFTNIQCPPLAPKPKFGVLKFAKTDILTSSRDQAVDTPASPRTVGPTAEESSKTQQTASQPARATKAGCKKTVRFAAALVASGDELVPGSGRTFTEYYTEHVDEEGNLETCV